MHFDLTDLQLFCLVAKEGSLTRAAQRQHLSLSAASSRIKLLEEQANQSLFHRQARGVSTTPAGQAFLHHAEGLLREVQQLRVEMRDYALGTTAHVRICANTTAVTDFLPEILAPFLSAHPQVNIELRERPNSDIARDVLDGKAELGVVAGDIDSLGLERIHISTDTLVIVVPKAHPFAKRKRMRFAETVDEHFVGMHHSSTLQEFLGTVAERLNKTLRMRIQVTSFDVLCRMVGTGVGIAIAPESVVARSGYRHQLAVVQLQDAWSTRKRFLLARSHAKLSPQAQLLVQDIQDYFKSAEV